MISIKLSPREKRLVLSTVTLLSLFLLYVLLLGPAIKSHGLVNRDIALKEAGLRRSLAIARQKKDIRNQYEKYVERTRITGSQEQEMGRLLRDIESLSAGLISFSSVRPRSVSELDFYRQFVVEADCETDIKALTQFIHKLENSGKMLKVTKLRLNAKEDRTGTLKSAMLISKILVSHQ